MAATAERTVTAPYIDHRTATTKRTPDWIVTIKQGASIQVHRFSTQERAQEFYEAEAAK
jgi:hypothetical protein